MNYNRPTFRNRRKNFQLSTKWKLLIVLQLIASLVFGQQGKYNTAFKIEGSIKKFGNGMLVGGIVDPTDHAIRLDTIVVRNDSFRHFGHIKEMQIVRYKAAGDQFAKFRKLVKDGDTVLVDLAEEKSISLEIVAFPGAAIKVSGSAITYLDAYPSGTKENEQLANLNRVLYPLFNEIGNLKINYSKKTYDSLSKRENAMLTQIANAESAFINRHPSSIVTAYIVYEKFKTWNGKEPDKADSLYRLIQPYGDNYYKQQILVLQRGRSKTKSEIAVGDTFPMFKTKFVYNGPGFDLNQTRGKYTLIDFWGSWCIPCVREMPKLLEYYERYKDKLNIVGIANDKYQSWKTFLDKNKLTWVQILDQDAPKIVDMLHIKVYPTKYLLDPEGRVIMIFIDADEKIWKTLDELLT